MSLSELLDGMTDALQSCADTPTTSSKPDGEQGFGSKRDGELSPDGNFRWSAGWDAWVPTGEEPSDYWHPWDLSPNQILGGAALVPIHHRHGCLCTQCINAGQRRLDWNKDRRNEW